MTSNFPKSGNDLVFLSDVLDTYKSRNDGAYVNYNMKHYGSYKTGKLKLLFHFSGNNDKYFGKHWGMMCTSKKKSGLQYFLVNKIKIEEDEKWKTSK